MDDIRERDFKTTSDHWTIVVDFFENYPQMVKRTFSNHAEDNKEIKKLWESLTAQLNGLGTGKKSIEKWQQAIGRWKSKVKSKASTYRTESLKTGGGPCMALPLNAIEERLMNIYGWKSIDGDGNFELGFQKMKESKSVEKRHEKVHNNYILEVPPLTFIDNTVGAPLLIPLNEMDENPSTSAVTASINRKTSQNDHLAKNKKKKTVTPRATSLIKSRRFVSMSKMHSEHLDFLKSIDNKVGVMSSAIVEMKNDLKRLVDHMISD